ncbi:glucan endo-1,3-beta-glucosidase 12 isoform X3 [Hevea brasiliensis]|uniref:glucan endo-1,3-beta-glucosidase 12 isoform X3 n=1 Tax=Hevea brasiliensis TaxID=3981 RepID=UPI000B77C8A3|nr:glucan endo-1,3-beta-glucosidase 12 isoform X3 [Hevea brasiliensis]
MPKPTSTLPFLSLLLMLSYFNLGGNLKVANGQVKVLNKISPLNHFLAFITCYIFLMVLQKTWCVVNPLTRHAELLANLDYACNHVGCSQIQQGGSCFYPNTYIHHASFAMNLYYQYMGRHEVDCNFTNSGLISLSDPSSGSCTYESDGDIEGNGTSENEISETWCVVKPTTEDYMLQENINFSCNHVDCSPIKDGGSCFQPTTLMNHAAFAMNLYYQSTGRGSTSCDFRGTGLIVTRDPGYGNCTF